MINIGLFGFGRIGRSLTRQILDLDDINLNFICDANPSRNNLEYLLKYDSTYGILKYTTCLKGSLLRVKEQNIEIFLKNEFDDINFENIDLVIDATGSADLNNKLRKLIKNYPTTIEIL